MTMGPAPPTAGGAASMGQMKKMDEHGDMPMKMQDDNMQMAPMPPQGGMAGARPLRYGAHVSNTHRRYPAMRRHACVLVTNLHPLLEGLIRLWQLSALRGDLDKPWGQ